MATRARRVATALARGAFGCSLLLAGVSTWGVCVAAQVLLPRRQARAACRLACKACWSAALFCTPWIRLRPTPPPAAWRAFADDAQRGRGAVLLLNHASPMDPLFFMAAAPWRVAALPLRVLVHARHFRAPLFGRVCKVCGHFPVHFVARAAPPAGDHAREAREEDTRRVAKALQARTRSTRSAKQESAL
jgi:1-acyl-sn-glycerol-3-phosphate acyltransferase